MRREKEWSRVENREMKRIEEKRRDDVRSVEEIEKNIT